MIAAIFHIIAFFALVVAVYLYPKSADRQNAFLWIPVSLLLCECYSALVAGLLSLIHIPVTLFSMGIAFLLAACALFFLIRRQGQSAMPDNGKPDGSRGERTRSIDVFGAQIQRYEFRISDFAFGVILLALIAVMGYMRFFTANPIIFATIDPAERFGNAMNIAVLKSVITHFPNQYFIQLSGSLFIQSLQPFFPGVLPFRFFEIKDLLNLWFTGALFYAAAGCYMKHRFSRVIAFLLSFAFVCGYPWNNQLFGFVYPGVGVNLIMLALIGAALLLSGRLHKIPAMLIIAFACLGTGVCYTLFVPPLFVAAFLAVAIYLWRARKLSGAAVFSLAFVRRFALTELAVFLVPTVWTVVNAFVLDAGGEYNVGNSITAEGAIYRNLFTDFLPYIPFALYFIYRAIRKKEWDFVPVSTLIFGIYQIGFFALMLMGKISTYYYYKLNFVTWFIFLFLACLAVEQLSEHIESRRLVAAYLACWIFVGALGILGYDSRLSVSRPLANPSPGADVSFRVYMNNLFYFPPPGSNNIINISWDFIDLCTEAKRLSEEQGISARVEIVTDDFQASFWKDALTSQLLIYHVGIPQETDGLWIVLKDDWLYDDNKNRFDGMPKLYENEYGFIVQPEIGIT